MLFYFILFEINENWISSMDRSVDKLYHCSKLNLLESLGVCWREWLNDFWAMLRSKIKSFMESVGIEMKVFQILFSVSGWGRTLYARRKQLYWIFWSSKNMLTHNLIIRKNGRKRVFSLICWLAFWADSKMEMIHLMM